MGIRAINMNGPEDHKAFRKNLIVGLGKTGLSCARYLAAQGEQIAMADSRQNPPGLAELRQELPDTAVFLGDFDQELFLQADRLLVSPGVPLTTEAVAAAIEQGVEVIGDIELFGREAAAPVAVITGSNGKSTVTTLLGEMAKSAGVSVAVGGNLGEPALDLLEQDAQLYVLELSSFQLETIESLKPKVAVVLNISADHMDRYDDIEHYASVKSRIYSNAEISVINLDDTRVRQMPVGDRKYSFTLGEPVDGNSFGIRRRDGESWLCQGDTYLLSASELLIPGRHNLANALAALAMGAALQLDQSAMLQALRHFRGLPHRTEFVLEHQGVSWFNDSKATNVGATIAALDGLMLQVERAGGSIILIAGGDCKEADLSGLTHVLGKCAKAVISMGRDAQQIDDVVPGHVRHLRAASMQEAVALASKESIPGDVVLLSPACASLDMYRDYMHRGDEFIRTVREQTS